MLKDTRSLGKDSSDASIYRVAEAFRPTMGIDKSLLGKDAGAHQNSLQRAGLSG